MARLHEEGWSLMASFRIKVPNDDEGEDLGEYQSDYLPRVGEPFFLWHPRLGFDGSDGDHPFCGIVSEVVHEAQYAANGVERSGHPVSVVTTTVWLTEEHGAPNYSATAPRMSGRSTTRSTASARTVGTGGAREKD